MKAITLTLNHAEAVFLANVLDTARENEARLGLAETDTSEQHAHMVNFRHAEALKDRLDDQCRHVVFGW